MKSSIFTTIIFAFVTIVSSEFVPRFKRQNSTTCPTIPTPLNGQIEYYTDNIPSLGSGYPTGATATLSCTTGVLAGNRVATCQNGIWAPVLGSCPETLAPPPGTPCLVGPLTPLNGQLKYSTGSLLGPYPIQSSVELICNPGYTAIGTLEATCVNGAFHPPTLGECIIFGRK